MSTGSVCDYVKRIECYGCGTCYSVCSQEAIDILKDDIGYFPKINKRCNSCGLCTTVCPALKWDFENDYKSTDIDIDPLFGAVRSFALVHSKNTCIRFNASSGGFISTALQYLLENNLVDGAIVAIGFKGDDRFPRGTIITSPQHIVGVQGSKYAPVALNKELKKVLRNSDKKYAFVGLPCHLSGLNNMEHLLGKLKKIIPYRFGIFCGHGVSFKGTEVFLKSLGIKPTEITNVKYRSEGWPGYFKASRQEQNPVKTPSGLPWGAYWSNNFFCPPACLGCPDFSAHMGDISCGDPWIPNFEDPKGSSMLIVRTLKGEELIRDMVDREYINAVHCSYQQAYKAHEVNLLLKRIYVELMNRERKRYKMRVPEIKDDNLISYTTIRAKFIVKSKVLATKISYKYPRIFEIIPLKVQLFLSRVFSFFLSKFILPKEKEQLRKKIKDKGRLT